MKPALLLLVASAALSAAPCISVANCTEFVTLSGGPARSLIYRSQPLDAPNTAITRALVVVHGTGRDADNYFRTALASAFVAGALDDTVIIVPRIASAQGNCHDKLAENEVSWSCNGDSWRSGGVSASNPNLNSFDFMDAILQKIAKKDSFPNLKTIVVAGHSAGGQYVNRYSMANRVHDTLGIPVNYVVANPSSYAWPDATRPDFNDGRNCTTYNRWPYGLTNRESGYTAKMSDDQLRKQLSTRPITYLLGEIDILPLGGFDASCPAMAQGPTRRARGEAFQKFVTEKLGAKSPAVIVHLCGHNARCMFTADEATPLLYPKQ
jgi:hypothetical protein